MTKLALKKAIPKKGYTDKSQLRGKKKAAHCNYCKLLFAAPLSARYYNLTR